MTNPKPPPRLDHVPTRSYDSEADMSTVIPTPTTVTPSPSRGDVRDADADKYHEDQDALDEKFETPEGKEGVVDEPQDHRHALNSPSHVTLADTNLAPTRSHMSDRAADLITLEAALRSQARAGVPAHGEEGVMEKRTVVDLGDGPEEVVLVDWLPNDPEVSHRHRWDGRAGYRTTRSWAGTD